MSNTQYAVCHLQRGSGNDSGMSCHIERKDANGKKYIPVNADANRTQLNRELKEQDGCHTIQNNPCRTTPQGRQESMQGYSHHPDRDT